MKERIYKDFDLPTNHLQNSRHYVPPKARKPAEVDRRRAMPRGVLLAEHQQQGIAVAATILGRLERPEDKDFALPLIAASAINTAWYIFARNSEVMRRRLKLPLLAAGDSASTPDSEMLLGAAVDTMVGASGASTRLLDAIRNRRPLLEARQKQFGRQIGYSSLVLASVPLGDAIPDMGNIDDFRVQELVRSRSLMALHDSRVLGDEIGVPPSMAQLGDVDSELSVHWRRHAPNGALEAYEAAVQQHLQLVA